MNKWKASGERICVTLLIPHNTLTEKARQVSLLLCPFTAAAWVTLMLLLKSDSDWGAVCVYPILKEGESPVQGLVLCLCCWLQCAGWGKVAAYCSPWRLSKGFASLWCSIGAWVKELWGLLVLLLHPRMKQSSGSLQMFKLLRRWIGNWWAIGAGCCVLRPCFSGLSLQSQGTDVWSVY